MRENTNQNNSEYGHFSRSNLFWIWMNSTKSRQRQSFSVTKLLTANSLRNMYFFGSDLKYIHAPYSLNEKIISAAGWLGYHLAHGSEKFKSKHGCSRSSCSQRFFKGLQSCNFMKKRLQHRCFPPNFAKFLQTPFFIEHLWWLLLTLKCQRK